MKLSEHAYKEMCSVNNVYFKQELYRDLSFCTPLHLSSLLLLFCLLADGQRQEVSLGGSASRQCFYDLSPSSQYQISIHTQMQGTEGPSVSITDMTCMLQVCLEWSLPLNLLILLFTSISSPLSFNNLFFSLLIHY